MKAKQERASTSASRAKKLVYGATARDPKKHSRNLIDLWMAARNVDFKTALHEAAAWLGVSFQSKDESKKSNELLDARRGSRVHGSQAEDAFDTA